MLHVLDFLCGTVSYLVTPAETRDAPGLNGDTLLAAQDETNKAKRKRANLGRTLEFGDFLRDFLARCIEPGPFCDQGRGCNSPSFPEMMMPQIITGIILKLFPSPLSATKRHAQSKPSCQKKDNHKGKTG